MAWCAALAMGMGRRLSGSASPAGAGIAAWPLLALAIGGGWVISSRILARGSTTAQVTTHVRAPVSRGLCAAAMAMGFYVGFFSAT